MKLEETNKKSLKKGTLFEIFNTNNNIISSVKKEDYKNVYTKYIRNNLSLDNFETLEITLLSEFCEEIQLKNFMNLSKIQEMEISEITKKILIKTRSSPKSRYGVDEMSELELDTEKLKKYMIEKKIEKERLAEEEKKRETDQKNKIENILIQIKELDKQIEEMKN